MIDVTKSSEKSKLEFSDLFFTTLEQRISDLSSFDSSQKKRSERIIRELSLFLSQFFPSEIVQKTALELSLKLEKFFEHEVELQRLTRVRVIQYFLILLDTNLSHLGEKITPIHLELLKKQKIIPAKSKICSYLEIKKKQKELERKKLIQKSSKVKFSELIRKRVNSILQECETDKVFRRRVINKIRERTNILLKKGIKPHIDVNQAAIVFILSISRDLKVDRRISKRIMEKYCDKYNLDKKKIRRQYYQFNRRILQE
ncbi:MAG: hypothetical protein ACTSVB_10810 [Candidatus Heimdallarchaeaceae archaeon]